MIKKTLTATLCISILSGCVSAPESLNNNNKIETPITEQEMKNSQYVMYNAIVGKIMEGDNKTNNAINNYENILSRGYNKETIDKIIPLYLNKSDYVALNDLISGLDIKRITENHKEYEFIYYINNKDYLSAANKIENDLSSINANDTLKDTIIKRNYVYQNVIKKINTFYSEKDGNNYFDEIIYELSNINKSASSTLTIFKNNNTEDEIDSLLNKNDEILTTLLRYHAKQKNEDLVRLYNSGWIFDSDMNSSVEKHFSRLYSEGQIEELRELSIMLNKYKDTVNSEVYETMAYITMFENNNALYKLEKIKDRLNADYYNYFKAITNYRLGYKTSANRYLEKIDNFDVISTDLILYYDVNKDLTYLQKNMSEPEILSLRFEYYLKKKNIKKAESILKEIKEKEYDVNFENDLMTYNEFYYQFLKDEKNGLALVKKHYEKDKSLVNGNFYAYLLALANVNINEGLDIINSFNEKEFDSSVLDTKAWLLYKNKDYQAALNIFKENNLMYSESSETQSHIAKIYYKLGYHKKFDEHMSYSNMLFNQK